jgi:hypothetical protein
VYCVGSEPSFGYDVFVGSVATSAALFGSTAGLAEIGVFHGPLALYGTEHEPEPDPEVDTDTVQVTLAGLEVSPLFTASTENVCEPLTRPE